MHIVNLTLHDVSFVLENGETVCVPASGKVARLTTSTQIVGQIGNIPITETVFGQIENLPDPTEGEVYIVSSLVAGRVPDRQDVFIPNESIRDDAGRIIGCRSLGRI